MWTNQDSESLIHVLEDTLVDNRRDQSSRTRENGTFKYIPLAIPQFVQQIEFAQMLMLYKGIIEPSFIDVGCGVGTKVLIAAIHGFRAEGLEIDPEYVKIAKRLNECRDYCSNSFTIWEGNALEHNFAHYDVIYFYCPFADEAKERRLESHIVKSAHPGALILANSIQHRDLFFNKKKFLRLKGSEYGGNGIFEVLPSPKKVTKKASK